jgi:hypothetical protein
MHPYGGSNWWALPNETVKLIFDFLEVHPDYMEYHRFTHCPDEVFFNSIVANLIDTDFIEQSLTYTNWERKNCPLPVTFGFDDFEELRFQPHKLFARKFDDSFDSKILNKIDQELLLHEN